MRDIYLDHAATTPLDPAVLEAMHPALSTVFGNPSSVHRPGQAARRLVERAREQVAEAVGARPRDVVFTSSATEADNLALRGLLAGGGALLTSPLEHAAVRATAEALERAGTPVRWLRPEPNGALEPAALEHALREAPGTRVVALMQVNNETGVLTDVAAMARVAHAAGALLMVDAVQAMGLEEVTLGALQADALVLSGHKIYGPKGVGVLVLAPGIRPAPLLYGGEQEGGLRPGTHDTAAIVGMGEAVVRAKRERPARRRATAAARDTFERVATSLEGVEVNGAGAPRGVKHSNLRIHGVDGEALLMALDAVGVSLSAGSACAAGSLEPSPVLLAMGLDAAAAKASLRASFGHRMSEAEAEEAGGRLLEAVRRCRRVAA